MQFLRERNFKQTIQIVRVEDVIDKETASIALRRATKFFAALQSPHGHWPAENAGPMFYFPPLVLFLFLFIFILYNSTTILPFSFRYFRCILRDISTSYSQKNTERKSFAMHIVIRMKMVDGDCTLWDKVVCFALFLTIFNSVCWGKNLTRMSVLELENGF